MKLDIIIKRDRTILEALQKLQDNKKRFLLCVDEFDKVAGIITDGDIRRAFLNKFHLDDKVYDIYNQQFEYLELSSSFDTVCEKFKLDKIDFLPILNEDKKLVNIIRKKQFHIMLLENFRFDLTYDFSRFDNNTLEYEIYNKPWGFYKSTFLTSHAQSKIITVFANEELSLQEHKKREEHWVIIKGHAKVILGESELYLNSGAHVYIPKGVKHQLINLSSDENLILAEVQLGEYFGEDDIVRYSDKYGRK
ncbi:MAG: CBS domain-containing protein [Sulfurimonas sp.]|uniref:CBS domain-containing protein n=1 Tax=Sulfurimonas sp. TaxID=2022749 RepID=UPI0026316EAB|nr:CBS domain-containing protein [Sulfurimonas sp.]MDD2652974.1 CBS domain-containing protein [Sulfurimonas sp.]MDD3452420.1 CBS domain-containing protein [Sulfurimonas sp.]